MKNNFKINEKYILICLKCKTFILIEKIFLYQNCLHFRYRCGCTNNFKSIQMDNLKNILLCTRENLVIKKNNNYLIINNNWIKINNINNLKKEKQCACVNQKKIFFCINCLSFICQNCSINHHFHKKLSYEQDVLMNKKNIHKLEILFYHSYFSIKRGTQNAKSMLIKMTSKNNKEIALIDGYIKNNEAINDSISLLFHLVMNTFKCAHTLSNYLNLTHFGYFNSPFKFPPYYKDNYRTYNKLKVIQLFIKYCKNIFLIPLKSEYIHFSLLKKCKTPQQKNYILSFNTEEKKQYLKGEKVIKESEQGQTIEITVPSRIIKVLILDDQKIAIYSLPQFVIQIYTYNTKKNEFLFHFSINTFRLADLYKLNHSMLLGISILSSGLFFKTTEKEMNAFLFFSEIVHCFELNCNSVILLSKQTPFIVRNYWIKTVVDCSPCYEFHNFTFGFKLSNGLFLLYQKNIIIVVKIESKITVISTIKNNLFQELFNNKLKVCYENAQKKRLYFQTEKSIVIMHSETFQIQSIYHTYHFLFYPLDNTKRDLLSYFEKLNFDFRKISNVFLNNENKDIFQISDNLLLLSTSKHSYIYTIN